MKSTGIVRKVDNLGRFVLPIELRRMFEIAPDDNLEIFIDKNIIILKKYMPDCMVCGETKNDMIFIGEQRICRSCLDDIYQRTHKEMEL